MAQSKRRADGSGKRWGVLLALLLLLIIIGFVLFRLIHVRENKRTPHSSKQTVLPTVPDTSIFEPDTTFSDTAILEDLVESAPEVKQAKPIPIPLVKPDVPLPETTAVNAVADSSHGDDTVAFRAPDLCAQDTTELWVYPDPSGGLHYHAVQVAFIANRSCSIHYRFENDKDWKLYTGEQITIAATTTLYFDALDSCGNMMERRQEYYKIETEYKKVPCPEGMVQVKVGATEFCIDRYEWPNRKGSTPQTYISLYQAMDSCYAVDKRLCSAEEWAIACSGPYSWKYPYGQRYERYGCVTQDTMLEPSGSKPECRSFYGAFDMSGSLLEWTSTKAKENSSFFYVVGGFWESGPKSSCGDKRYSYYPQNRHNPVGFRCCRAIESSVDGTTGGQP